ncbi:MAG: BadF/BadG/BcrA/BcrD ATPase family protein [Granulosicoccus sp.]
MTLIVVVDGGGSRCRLAAFSQQGEMLARVVVDEHASLSLGVRAAWQHIDQGLRILRRELDHSATWQPSILCMGLAGSLQQRKRHEFLKLPPPGVRTLLHTDGYAQLIGATEGQPGICLAVGTGSVMHWLDRDGSHAMAGGWGFPVGDQGSGAWLGMRVLQSYIAHRDAKSAPSALMVSVERRIGASVSAIQLWTTQTRSSVLAQLAPLVFEAAASDDPTALSIIDEAVEHCLQLIRLAPADLPVYVVGGVGEQLSPGFSRELGDRLRRSRGDALRGLWHLAVSS